MIHPGLAALLIAAVASAHDVDRWSEPFEGVRYLHRTTDNPRLSVHATVIDLKAPGIRLVATDPAGKRATVSQFAKRKRAQIAVNGDFFNLQTRVPSCFAMGDGKHWAGTADTSGCGQIAAGAARVELVPPSAAFQREGWMTDVVSGHPMILKNGETVNADDPFLQARHPRTAVGVNRDRTRIVLLVVDGRQSHSIGTTGPEMAKVMRELGAADALNLDGGGSSAMYLAGKGVVNRPSDGQERLDANHLGVYARPRGSGGGGNTGGGGGNTGGGGGNTGGGGGNTGGGGGNTGGGGGNTGGGGGSSGGGKDPADDPRLLPGFTAALAKARSGRGLTAYEERTLRRALKVSENDVEDLMAKALERPLGDPPDGFKLKRGPVAPVEGEVSRKFGPSSFPLYPPRPSGGRMHAHFHSGLDLAAPAGTPVKAFDAGKVLHLGVAAGPGVQVVLVHPGKLATAYWHLAADSSATSRLRVGEWVNAGDVIGLVGETGVALRPYLHFMASRGWLIDPKELLPRKPRPAASPDVLPNELVVAGAFELPDGTELRLQSGDDLDRVPKEARLRFLPLVDERGNRHLAAFTSWERLKAWKADAPGLPMPAKTVLGEVGKGDFAGLLIDTETPYEMAITREQAAGLAE